MKKASELGLEVIQHLDYTLLVDRNHKANGEFGFDLETPKKIIASTRKLVNIPLLVIEDEVDKLARQEIPINVVEVSDTLKLDASVMDRRGFVLGYKAHQKTHPFTEEDLLGFTDWLDKWWRRGKSGWMHVGDFYRNDRPVKTENLMKIYIQRLGMVKKELWIEVDFYYHSSREFYGDKADWVVCDEAQFNSLKTGIPTCPLKMGPKIINNQLKAVWK